MRNLLLPMFMCLTAFSLSAQNRTVTGKVTDENSKPLTGATVSAVGGGGHALTDSSGNFTLTIPVRVHDLEVLYVGYTARRITLTGKTNYVITLSSAAHSLADVFVTGFQQIEKKKFTGAAVNLKIDEVKIEGVPDVSRMLEGRAAGVSVQNVSSTFGSAPKLRIRGATSINGENKPLWVVDGVVLEDIVNISNDQLSSGDPTTLLGSSVAGLNPNDIETFDILKDAAATALYGARAMNGVVVITTKKGRAGKPQISYTGNFSTQLKPQYVDYNIMNSAQQMS